MNMLSGSPGMKNEVERAVEEGMLEEFRQIEGNSAASCRRSSIAISAARFKTRRIVTKNKSTTGPARSSD